MTGNQIQYQGLLETARHNLAYEHETNRHNVATETETNRHNVVTEQVDWFNAHSNRMSAQAAMMNAAANQMNAETNRMRLSIDSTNAATLRMNAESNARNAKTNEYAAFTGRMSYYESNRHNNAMEDISRQHENIQQQMADEHERHNRANEAIGWVNTIWSNTNETFKNVTHALDRGVQTILDFVDMAKVK